MVIAIYRNKIVAKAENIDELPELNSDAIIVNGEEDLQGKDMKALIKLYNTTLPKDERVKVMPDVEGDINAAIVKTWEALEGYEIPEKGATATKSSTPRTERVYDRTNVPLVEGTVMPTQAKVILEVLAKEGPLSKTALEAALDGKITTKQPIGRIVAFYQKRLVDEGYITMS